jgi:hypothetical protein
VRILNMGKMARLALRTLIVGGILAVGTSAHAQFLTYGAFATSTPIAYTTTDWVSSLTFPKFDSNLGTLFEIRVTLTVDIITDYTLSNTSSNSVASGTISTNVRVNFRDPGPPHGLVGTPGPPATNGILGQNSYSVTTAPFAYTVAPSSTVLSGPQTASVTQVGTITLAGYPSVIPDFVSSNPLDTVTLPTWTRTNTSVTNSGGNFAFEQVTQAQVNGTITYLYLVPEPGTLSLFAMGIALGGSRIVRRRRK